MKAVNRSMRTILRAVPAASLLSALAACSGSKGNVFETPDSGTGVSVSSASGSSATGGSALDSGGLLINVGDAGGCQGTACTQVTCDAGSQTTISGTVYDPAGKVPLYNVIVYVPGAAVQPLPSNGATCDQCGASVSGSPIVITLTDAAGNFVLPNAPAGTAVPLVMQVGKWRRQVTIPVTACTNNVVTDANVTRLPRNQSEGDIPRIAIATGGADPLECLFRKIGLDDSEFSTEGGSGRVHLYTGGGYTDADGGVHDAASSFASTLNSGEAFADATTLWDNATSLEGYDLFLLACEGELNADTKPDAALGALYDFENAGGRVFASHWHRYWFSNGPAPVPTVASWEDQPDPAATGVIAYGTVNTGFPKGQALSEWLQNVDATNDAGLLPIKDSKDNAYAINTSEAEPWITMPNPNAFDAGIGTAIEYLTFNTPIDQPASAQCGRVVYSDLHVSSGDLPGEPFPTGCVTQDLSPQEKALEFMLFDLSSCVQSDTSTPTPPPR